jgi:hypothetical protein
VDQDMKKFYLLLTVLIVITNPAKSQCTGTEAAWILGPRNGLMTNTGQLWGTVNVDVATVGTVVNGRPLYDVSTSTWKGLSYQFLQVGRAKVLRVPIIPTSNYLLPLIPTRYI